MKRVLILVVLVFQILIPVSADEAKRVTVKTRVPEDFGIDFPKNVLHMDHLYFAFINENDVEFIPNGLVDFGVMEKGDNSVRLSLLYYGNNGDPYVVRLTIEEGLGWTIASPEGDVYIPVSVEISQIENGKDGISVLQLYPASAVITVPATGPRRGDKACEIVFAWENADDVFPGEIESEININMEII